MFCPSLLPVRKVCGIYANMFREGCKKNMKKLTNVSLYVCMSAENTIGEAGSSSAAAAVGTFKPPPPTAVLLLQPACTKALLLLLDQLLVATVGCFRRLGKVGNSFQNFEI